MKTKSLFIITAILSILFISSSSWAYTNIDGETDDKCQYCHSSWANSTIWHDEHKTAFSCSDCHDGAASDPVPTSSCKDCHTDDHWEGKPENHVASENCMSCHEETEPDCPLESSMKIGDSRLTTLRQFRDEVLAANRSGRAMITFYYTAAPVLTRAVNSSPFFKQMTVRLIDAIMPVIEKLLD